MESEEGQSMENPEATLGTASGKGFPDRARVVIIDFDKPGGFVGREALLVQRENLPPKSRLVQFLLEDPDPLLYGEEPILRDGITVGHLRSGAYGHTLGGAMGFGYVDHADGVTPDPLRAGGFEILVAGERFPAKASLRPMYDPRAERVRM